MQISAAAAAAAAPFFAVAFSPFDGEIVFLEEFGSANQGLRFEVRSYVDEPVTPPRYLRRIPPMLSTVSL